MFIVRICLLSLLLMATFSGCESAHPKATVLQVKEQKISLNGKEGSMYAITQADGSFGLTLEEGSMFNVVVENLLDVPTSIHWHGLILPNDQDGVAFITQFPIYPMQKQSYRFPLVQSGTYWMHAHYGLQEQRLYAAPLILQDKKDDVVADQDVILMLSDFVFAPSPSEILNNLRCQNREVVAKPQFGAKSALSSLEPNSSQTAYLQSDMSVCDDFDPIKKSSNLTSKASFAPTSRCSMSMTKGGSDLNDVQYDAFLVNFHTIENPECILVKPNERVRLRIINSGASTNFSLDLGKLEAEVIAVDGNLITPVKRSNLWLSPAQRIDLLVKIPENGGAFPILAIGAGTSMQGGAILYTKGSTLPSLTAQASRSVTTLPYDQEKQFHAKFPLTPKQPDQKFELVLAGNMKDYVWTINNQAWPEITPLVIEEGKRIEITYNNKNMMPHPMHLHGHVFQVVAINGEPFEGALRDTVTVPPNSTVTIQFDANNPGTWPLHCHILYHGAAGMFTVVRY